MPYLVRSWQTRKLTQKQGSQALGPSTSEPPSKTMPDGTGMVGNHALFGSFIANTQSHDKSRFPGLGTIKIGTAVKNYAGW